MNYLDFDISGGLEKGIYYQFIPKKVIPQIPRRMVLIETFEEQSNLDGLIQFYMNSLTEMSGIPKHYLQI